MFCKLNLKFDVDIKIIQKILVDYGGVYLILRVVFDRWGYDTRGVLQFIGWVYLYEI